MKRRNLIFFIFLSCYCISFAHAEEVPKPDLKPLNPVTTSLEKKEISYEGALLKKEKQRDDKSFLTLSFENDLIGSGKDSDYTNGIRLTYMNTNANIPKVIKDSTRWLPFFDINDTTSIYYSFGQNLYTPDDIEQRNISNSDRPYAAWLYLSAGMLSTQENHTDEIEISVGTVGPAALGEQVQKFVHKAVDSPKPLGWKNQLKNEPGLILSWQRSWQNYQDFALNGFSVRSTPHIGTSLGNIYTYANTGISFSFMPSNQALQANPVRIRPAIPGSGYYDVPDTNFGWYLFGGIEGRAVARNIFLDGNSFTDSHDVDKKYLIMDANIGIAFTIKNTRLSYTLNYRTKEYNTQEDPQIFGSISLSQRF